MNFPPKRLNGCGRKREQNLQRAPDDQILAKAREEGRTVLTMDLDFGYLLAISKEKLPIENF